MLNQRYPLGLVLQLAVSPSRLLLLDREWQDLHHQRKGSQQLPPDLAELHHCLPELSRFLLQSQVLQSPLRPSQVALSLLLRSASRVPLSEQRRSAS